MFEVTKSSHSNKHQKNNSRTALQKHQAFLCHHRVLRLAVDGSPWSSVTPRPGKSRSSPIARLQGSRAPSEGPYSWSRCRHRRCSPFPGSKNINYSFFSFLSFPLFLSSHSFIFITLIFFTHYLYIFIYLSRYVFFVALIIFLFFSYSNTIVHTRDSLFLVSKKTHRIPSLSLSLLHIIFPTRATAYSYDWKYKNTSSNNKLEKEIRESSLPLQHVIS